MELPTIATQPSQDLNGAMGVYVIETDQIFLSESFLLTSTQDQIVAVLLEEIGHGLDARLNQTDSPGDEGAIFSALVRGQSLSEPQLAVLQAENDQATLLLDDQWVTVEQAELTVSIAAQNVVDGDTSDVTALLADPGADGLISLREAIQATNNTAGADTITFDQAGTITLDVIEGSIDGVNGLEINDDLTIEGDLDNDGTPDVTLDGDAEQESKRVMWVGNSTVTLNGLVITGGNANSAGAFGPGNNGGAIFNRNGILTVSNSTITGNESRDSGGGIYSFGEVADGTTTTVTNSTISGNTAGSQGGGLANVAYLSSAASVPNAAVMTIANSTITGNSANVGGGISNLGQRADNGAVIVVNNSTISGNTATFAGGGLYNRGQSASQGATLTVTSSTVTQNTVEADVDRAGGIHNAGLFGGPNTGRVLVGNSIIAQNTAASDVGQNIPVANAPFIDQGNNLIGIDATGIFTASTLVGSTATPLDPRLDVLADNGGPTFTHLLFNDSPALNAGSDALATAANLTTDQRRFSRFVEQIDIGATERQASTVSILASDAIADENTADDTATYRISRTPEIIDDLTVELSLTLGTDLNFSDFTLSGSDIAVNTTSNTATLTLPASQFFVDITLTPNDDSTPEADESLTLTLVDTNDYIIDTSNNAATATILANDPVVTTPAPTPAPAPTLTPTDPIDNTAPIGTISALPIPVRKTSVNQVQITFDEAVTNFDRTDVQLTRDGTVIDLTGVTLITTDNVTWTVEGLSTLTTEDGTYEITLSETTDVTDTAGNPLTTDTTITWQTGQTARGRREIDFTSRKEGKTSNGDDQGERIIGTPFDDVLRGGDGNDRIIAGFGKEQFGRDRLFGEGGNDVMKAGAGKDLLDGGAGRDRLFGGKNDDELIGGDGRDLLNGGKGDDVLNGGLGRDRIKVGPGRDTIVYSALNEGTDIVISFNPNQDLIDLSGIFSASEYAADNSFAQYVNYVQLKQIGNATHVTVDGDGNGSGTTFITLAKLKNTQLDAVSSRNFVLE